MKIDCMIDVEEFTEVFLYYIQKMGFSDYGYPDKLIPENISEHGRYSNDVFELSSFWWGECTCGAEPQAEMLTPEKHKDDCMVYLPNFYYKPTGFAMEWYKYPGRDMRANRKMNFDEFIDMMKHCQQSTYPIDSLNMDVELNNEIATLHASLNTAEKPATHKYIISVTGGKAINQQTTIRKDNDDFENELDLVMNITKKLILEDSKL